MHLYPVDGAASRVAADATAFPYRGGGWAGVIVGVDPDSANAWLITRWAQDYWRDLYLTAARGGYVNFLMDDGQDRLRLLPRQLRPAGSHQGPLRPGQHLPHQPEHPACPSGMGPAGAPRGRALTGEDKGFGARYLWSGLS